MKTAIKSAPYPLIFLIISFLCPVELAIYIGEIRLPPHRVALVILVPWALWRIATRADIRIRSFDTFFILFGLWTMWAYRQHDPVGGFVYGGSIALECVGAYLVPRAWIRDTASLRATLKVMLLAILTAGLLALPETLFGKIFTHDLMAQLTGYTHPTGVEQRAGGLTRAYSVFDHPIHYGTFCAGLFAMFWYAEKRTVKRGVRSVMISGATLLGVSSAPLLCIFLQLSMLSWEYLSRGLKQRMPFTMAILAGLYVGMSLVSNRSPMNHIATGMTFDSWTGFYRLQIWEHGLNNVWANPMIGIGLNEWERPSWMISPTVDAFWLVIAMRTGIPAILLVSIAILILGRRVVVRSITSRDLEIRRLATGWMMSLIALCLIAATVHFWNVLSSFFFFFLGLGGWAADPKRQKAKVLKPIVAADPLDQLAHAASLSNGSRYGPSYIQPGQQLPPPLPAQPYGYGQPGYAV
jgi:hypothetical protein